MPWPLISQFCPPDPTLLGKKKSKANKRLKFSEGSSGDELPKRKRAQKSKTGSPKKRKRLAQRKSREIRRFSAKPARKTKSGDKDQPQLDSVFHLWFTDECQEVEGLEYADLKDDFEQEIERFSKLKTVNSTLKEQFRGALLDVLAKRSQKDKARRLDSGKALRNWWVSIIKHNLDLLRDAAGNRREPSPTRSVTSTFLDNLRSRSGVHPRGENTRRNKTDDEHNDGFTDTDSDRSYEVLSSDESDGGFEAADVPEAHVEPPLTFDSEARAAYKAIKAAKDASELKEKAVSYVSDKLLFGCSYIHDMMVGNTPWPKFSKEELFDNCRKVAQLLDNVRMREELGKELSEKARKRMLQGESDALRDIRTSLHIARLGPGEGKNYRDRLTTEASRRDFEATFSDPKAFKYYMRSLAEVKKNNSSRNSSSSGSFRGGTGPFRPPRRSRGSRGRRRARSNRGSYGTAMPCFRLPHLHDALLTPTCVQPTPLTYTPMPALGHARSTSRRGYSSRSYGGSSRYRSSSHGGRRFGSASRDRRRQRF